MRKTLGVSLLILLLTGTTSAGIMPNGSPTPPPTNSVQEPTLDGIMPNGMADSLTQTALDLFAVLSSLL
jgi:hypothetical protein